MVTDVKILRFNDNKLIDCFKNIKSNDCVWFQYRIIQRILGTKSYLHKTNIADNSICIYCKFAAETIDHLLIHCPLVSDFWEQLNIKRNGRKFIGFVSKI